MQVQFTANELQVLTDTLAQHNRELIHEIARTDHRDFKHMLQAKLELLTRLHSQLAPGELQLNRGESDALAEVLYESERSLYFEIARTDNRDFKHMLQKNLEWLEDAHHKITGTCTAA